MPAASLTMPFTATATSSATSATHFAAFSSAYLPYSSVQMTKSVRYFPFFCSMTGIE